MSGTSADGIDAALIRVGSQDPVSLGLVHAVFERFSEEQRNRIFAAFSPDFSAHELGRLNSDMGKWFADAVNRLLSEAGMSALDVLVIGSHGQTVAHYPPEPGQAQAGYCVQIGDPSVIAALTGIDVVSHFRAADMALGGQGAPLVPYFDYMTLGSPIEDRVILNIGGIANVTLLPRACGQSDVMGFDTGPGNMVIDGLVELISDGSRHFDEGGQMASLGRVRADLLEEWLNHPYFSVRPPKSTGREMFGRQFCRKIYENARDRNVAAEDLVRTACAFVAETIARAVRAEIRGPVALIASGGGTRNPVLMWELHVRLDLLRPWEWTDTYGIPSDFKEAMAFALLAWQFLRGVPTNLPRVTGAERLVVQGSWTPASRRHHKLWNAAKP